MSAVEPDDDVDDVEDEADRTRRPNRACAPGGLRGGAARGGRAATITPVSAFLSGMMGAARGGAFGRAIATRISPDEWAPPFNRRPFVGARSPDDDDASSAAPPQK